MKFPLTMQPGARDCGPTCLKMISDFYGYKYSLNFLKKKCRIRKVGVSMLDISRAAKKIGFEVMGAKMNIEKLKRIVKEIPVILYWKNSHFVVIYKAPRPKRQGKFYIADPAIGLVSYRQADFAFNWMNKKIGYCLIIEPAAV